eukprot:6464530-Amphidinium_carterae.1
MSHQQKTERQHLPPKKISYRQVKNCPTKVVPGIGILTFGGKMPGLGIAVLLTTKGSKHQARKGQGS